MADPRDSARAIRAAENYETLKDSSIMKYHVSMGDIPDQRKTGMDDAQYGKLVDAIRYGQQINNSTSMNDDLAGGLGDIVGLKSNTSKMKDGATLIEVEEDEQRFPADSHLP